ncbi:MAG: hypothetical protein AB7U98_00335 [Candidatus Nitrosocosmicus sp.]
MLSTKKRENIEFIDGKLLVLKIRINLVMYLDDNKEQKDSGTFLGKKI